MPIELKVPSVGESITEVEIGEWLKDEGDFVEKDASIAIIESDKATVELPSPVAGKITKLLKGKGDTAKVGETIAWIETSDQPASSEKPAAPEKPTPSKPVEQRPVEMPQAKKVVSPIPIPEPPRSVEVKQPVLPGGRLAKEKCAHLVHETMPIEESFAPSQPKPNAPERSTVTGREEQSVRMTKLRRTIATRLVEAQHNAALLTTFNEIDMSQVMALRKELGEAFLKKYGVKLGFMSFFVKASIDALQQHPAINAEIREENIIYKNYFDIGVAIGSGKGLVVPVLRNAERLSFAEVETAIGDLAKRAQENALKPDELQGGTFTITNGGVYGSLLSTPIVNPPQSGVLGLHAIQERPIALNGAVGIRPMMYVALTYDHRMVDGREAVTFLRRIKETIENPARMLIEV